MSTAVDVSKAAIKRAGVNFADTPTLSFAIVDVTARRSGHAGAYDAVLDRGCLHGIPPTLTREYGMNIRRWTKPGASLVLILKLGRYWTDSERRQQVTCSPRTLL